MSVTTKVTNDTIKINDNISSSLLVKKGDSVKISFQPRPGYFLNYITLNGDTIPVAGNDSVYIFRNIRNYQYIEVGYANQNIPVLIPFILIFKSSKLFKINGILTK
ncbi:MAG: hypothetical protein ORN58_04330 [Sediminibacterium sp.]|nr:hypothetical protein [Sediminibacterium sp.]